MSFIDLEKEYDRVNWDGLWQVLRMYDLEGKLLRGVRGMYIDSSACVGVKIGESEPFRGETGVYHVPFAVQCIYG